MPIPDAGSQRSCTANTTIDIKPSQKTGMDWPRSATTINPWSQMLKRFTTVYDPISFLTSTTRRQGRFGHDHQPEVAST